MLHLSPQPAEQQALRCRAHHGLGVYECLRAVPVLLLIAALLPAADRIEPHPITAVRFWSLGDVTRIAIESDGEFSVHSDRLDNPDRLFFDLAGAKPTLGPKAMTVIPVWAGVVREIR